MASKRGNNEGSITKRSDGRWMARLTLPDGMRKAMYAKTRQEVARKLAEALRDCERGLPMVDERQTVATYLTTWLDTVQPTIDHASYSKYRQQLIRHVAPTLGGAALAKLSAQHLQALYGTKLKEGLSGTTVNLLHKILHRALSDALRLGLVQRNVTEMVDPPRRQPPEMKPLSPDQARALLAAARGNRLEALCLLALCTGMRRGELLALRWHDVDIERGILQVRATLKPINGKLVLQEPKTKRSRRRIALPPSACSDLRRHRARQVQERLTLGPAWHETDFVFPNTVGNPIDARTMLRRWFRPLLRKASLPPIRFHDLRHTAATLLLLQGVHPKVVSEMLGHASIAITLDLYSHVLPDMQREASAAMEHLLGPELRAGVESGVGPGVERTPGIGRGEETTPTCDIPMGAASRDGASRDGAVCQLVSESVSNTAEDVGEADRWTSCPPSTPLELGLPSRTESARLVGWERQPR